MKKIFRINKIIVLALAVLLLGILSGCSSPLTFHEDGIELRLHAGYQRYMTYEEVPTYTFGKGYNLNALTREEAPHEAILSGNDDFLVSDIITALFEENKDRLVIKEDNRSISSTTKMNRRTYNTAKEKYETESISLGVDAIDTEEGRISYVFEETAYVGLENGLQLTLEYRRFVSDGETYYAWRYTKSIKIYLHYPLMLLPDKEMLILTLPTYTRYSVGPQLKLDNVIQEETYLDPSYYHFAYRDDLPTQADSVEYITDYYKTYHNGVIVDSTLQFTYLDRVFKIEFLETSFLISVVSE